MKKAKQFTGITLVIISIVSIASLALKAPAGLLEPTSAPGSTMHTLDEIYANTLNSNTSSTGVIVPPEGAAMGRGKSYLLVAGVPGESTDEERQGWIEIMGFSYEMLWQPPDPTGGGASGKTDFSVITLVKQIDKASPFLSLYCANGTPIATVYIETTQVSKDTIPPVFYRIELENVLVAGVAPRLVYVGGEYVLIEEVALNYARIKWTYTYEDPKGDLHMFEQGWDLVENIPWK